MEKNKNTLDTFVDGLSGKEFDNFDAKTLINVVKDIADKIPANGEYDQNIISLRIGQYIYGIQECGKILASLGLVEKYQETQVDKEQAEAALVRAAKNGFSTAGERKLYAQMDEGYITAKNKLNEIQAVISYIENYRTSLDKAHLHCKKIIDRNVVEERFANDYEKHPMSDGWIKEESIKLKGEKNDK